MTGEEIHETKANPSDSAMIPFHEITARHHRQMEEARRTARRDALLEAAKLSVPKVLDCDAYGSGYNDGVGELRAAIHDLAAKSEEAGE